MMPADSAGETVAPSDERVIDLIAQGSPEGIELLYDRYGRLAYTLALRVLGDAGAAEDVVQEAYLSIWRRAASYRPHRGSLRTWVCSIVQHRAIDRLRGRSGRARLDLSLDKAPPEAALSDTWEIVAADLERGHIRLALDELPDEQRRTIELAYYAGYSQSEISALMSVPLGTVKGRTRMALRKLRSSLECQGLEWSVQ
jgi:RNA polymerase sigma-70 factor (ECF subfamily)